MNWQLSQADRELFTRQLDSFLPPVLFDAHAHLYDLGHFAAPPPAYLTQGPAQAGLLEYRSRMDEIHPGRTCDGLFFAYPHLALDIAAANTFQAAEARRSPRSRALMLVRPDMDPDFIRQTVRREGFVGLKCYHIFSAEKPTWEASIPSYLPEEHFRVAHEEHLVVMLHMVKSRALADPVNQHVIRDYATRYPNARWILAHAARGFNPNHTIEGIASLRGLNNVWFDTSAITEGGAYEAILEEFGPSRLLYGSDFPVSHLRARAIALGDSFLWVDSTNTRMDAAYAAVQPALAGLESLRVLRNACRHARLTDRDVEAVFRTNAEDLFTL